MKKNMSKRKKIWDLSLRLFHVTLIILVICLIISAKYDRLDVHQYFGVALLGLIIFRVFWGVLFGMFRGLFRGVGVLFRGVRGFCLRLLLRVYDFV